MGWRQGQAYSQDLRDRVLTAVDGGMRVRRAGPLFGVSVAYIYKALIRRRLTGSASASPDRGHKLRTLTPAQEAGLRAHLAATPGITLAQVQAWLLEAEGVQPGMTASWKAVRRLGFSFKKPLRAAEQDRPDVAGRRRLWKAVQPFPGPRSLVFLDETGVNTRMARLHGWAPAGERCKDAVPFGHWKTMTFIAGLIPRLDAEDSSSSAYRPARGRAFGVPPLAMGFHQRDLVSGSQA